MKLSIKNLAKIRQAEIELNGLTVIAGDNDTGKSTVGKAIYAMFNGFRNMTRTVHNQRCRSLAYVVFNAITVYDAFHFQEPSVSGTINELNELEDTLKKEHELTADLVIDKARTLVNSRYSFDILSDKEKLGNMKQRLTKILQVSDGEIACQRVGVMFDRVFQHQSNSLQKESVAELQMQIKNQMVNAVLKDNVCTDANIDFNLNNSAIYIDNPFIIDRLSEAYYSHDALMMNSLERRLRKRQKVDLVTNIVNNKTLNAVMKIIDDIVPGVFAENDNVFTLIRPEWKEPLNVANLSAGVKSYAIFKLLIQNHQLLENDVVILDEPEIHLHPSWQQKYAEFLVLFQKAFALTILLTTHSPYFLNAIDVYSRKYDSLKNVKYYQTEVTEDSRVCLLDVTDNLETIYAKMAAPIIDMRRLRDELDKGDGKA